MAAYVLAAVLLVGIPFLLYCLWNFSREIKPRKADAFFSPWPTLGSVPANPVSRFRRQNASFNPETKVVHRPDHDYASPARVS
jgi:hypothetical protein